jgi:hypothetical protein
VDLFNVDLMLGKGIRKWLIGTAISFTLSAASIADNISQQQWRRVANLSGVPSTFGLNLPSIYVFFDANCPASAKLFRRNDQGESFADAQIIWIPVYYMAADSLGKAAAILRAGQFSMIKNNFMRFDDQKKSGTITPVLPNINERQKIDKANQVWRELTDTPGTPMIVYKDKWDIAHIHLGYNPPEELERIVTEAPSSRMQEYK